MKVNGNPQHAITGIAMRDAAKARSSAAAASAAAATAQAVASSPAAASATPTGTPAPAESTVEMAARKLPPGLVRVAARLEAMGVEGRTGGQSNALAQITRNLQRYAETQGMATPPTPLPDAPVAPPVAVNPVVPPPDSEVPAADAASATAVESAEPALP